MSAITVGELFFGARNKAELARIASDMESIQVIQVNEPVSQLAIALIRRFALSHKLHLPDALIATTGIYYDLPIYTLNLKDFRFIPELKIWTGS